MLGVMVMALIAGIGALVALLAPYSAYGRIAQTLLAPVWQGVNNLLAGWAEANDSYTFYKVDIWMRSGVTLAVALVTLIALGFLAWRNGRHIAIQSVPWGRFLDFSHGFHYSDRL